MQVAARHAEAGNQAEEEGSRNGDEDRPSESSSVDAQHAQQRQGDGSLMRKPRNKDVREAETERGARAGKDQALGEELTHDADATGAKSPAHGELL